MSVGSPTAGTWSSSQWRPDNEFETDILPTFFHSDLDRGFSVVDYDRNEELVSETDLEDIDKLGINLKFDLVLNHLSVGSPQFQDMLEHGDDSQFKDFFVNWNEFWGSHGTMGNDGYVIPKEEHL